MDYQSSAGLSRNFIVNLAKYTRKQRDYSKNTRNFNNKKERCPFSETGSGSRPAAPKISHHGIILEKKRTFPFSETGSGGRPAQPFRL